MGGKGAVCARAAFTGLFGILRWGRTEGDMGRCLRVLGIPLGWPRAVEFSSCLGFISPPGPAEALRSPLGLG